MPPLPLKLRRSLSLLLLVILPQMTLADVIIVRAIDESSGVGIPEAILIISGQGRRETSDAGGWISAEVPESGIYEGMVSATGFTSRRIRLELHPDAPNSRQDVFLQPIILDLEAFEVAATLTDEDRDLLASREAINPTDQISGDALKEITDDSVADTLSTLAGVSVESEEGTTTGVNIRGASARSTRITVDGQSMAGGGGRGTTRGAQAMNQIPKEFLNRIQVMKAPTPNMDADAIGGTVNLQTTKIAKTQKPRTSFALRSSYQEAGGTWGTRMNVAHAHPFALGNGKRFGILLAVNAQNSENNTDDLRVLNQWPTRISPETGERSPVMARFRIGNRVATTTGFGLVLNADLQLGKSHHFYLKTLWNERTTEASGQYHTFEFIRGKILSLTPDTGAFQNMRLEKQLNERKSRNSSGSIVLGGSHRLENWTFEESIGLSYANTHSPGTTNGLFRTARNFDGAYSLLENPVLPRVELTKDGAPVSPEELLDGNPYGMVRYDQIDDYANDAELAMAADATRRWERGEINWLLKSGFKARLREAEKDQDKFKFNPTGASYSLADVSTAGPATIFRDMYAVGPAWSRAAMDSLFMQDRDNFTFNPLDNQLDSAAGDFSVKESIYASYAMIQRKSENWIFVTGVRVELTDSQTKGFETISMKDETGERTLEINPVTIDDSYYRWFPGAHVLFRPNDRWTLRSSLTRTLQRPDFRDLSPSIRIDLDTKRIRSGNPDLEPFDAKAIDFGVDFIINQYGSASVGLFYKRIDDFIVDIEEQTEYFGEPGFIRSRPVNGSPADLLGLEAAWFTALPFLPGPFETTTLSANYTITDSTAAYPGYDTETIMLPEQVEETLNLALRWKYDNWTLSLRSRYRGLQLRDLIRPGQDQFNAGFWSHSVSVAYKMNDTLSFSVGFSNLNRPDRYSYQGTQSQVVSNREGSRAVSLGLNMRFGGYKKPTTKKI